MTKSKIIPILVLSFVLLISLGSVSANELSDNTNNLNMDFVSVNDTVNNINNINDVNKGINVDNIDIDRVDYTADSSKVNNVNANLSSFTDLQNDIDGAISGGKTLDLNKNYIYQGGDSGKIVEIKGDLTVNGNGHIIDGSNLVSIFNISNSNVIINNVVFTRSNGDFGILVFNSNLILNNVSFIDNEGNCDIRLTKDSKLTVNSSNSNRKTASIINNGGNITNLEIVVLNNNTLGATEDYYDLFAKVSVGGLSVNGENFVFVIDGEELLNQNLIAIDYEHTGYYTSIYEFDEPIKSPISVGVKYEGNSSPTIFTGKLQSASLLIPNNYECYRGDIVNIEVILDAYIDGEIKLFLLNQGDNSIDGVLTNSVSISADGKYHYIIPVNTSNYGHYDMSVIIASLFVDGEELLWNIPNKYIKVNKILPTIEDIYVNGAYGDIVNISATITNGNVGDEVILFITPTPTDNKYTSLTYLDGNKIKVDFKNINLLNTGVYNTLLIYNHNNLSLVNAIVHWNVSKVDTLISFNQIISKGVVNVDYGVILYVNDTKNNNLVSGDYVKVTYFDKKGNEVENKIFTLVNGQIPLNFKFNEAGIYSVKFEYLGGNFSFNRDNYNPSNATLLFNISTANINIIISDAFKNVSGKVNETILIKGKVSDVNGNIPKGNITITVNGITFTGVINETTGEFTVKVNSSVAGSWDDCVVSFVSANESVWTSSNCIDLIDITVNQLVPVVVIDSNSVSGVVNESILISGSVVDGYGNAPRGSVVITVNGVDFTASVNDDKTFKLYVNSSISGTWKKLNIKFITNNSSIWKDTIFNSKPVTVKVNNLDSIITINNAVIYPKVGRTAYLEGNVKDSTYGLPVSGSVYITVNGVKFNATVDAQGNFKIPITVDVVGTYTNLLLNFVSSDSHIWNNAVTNSNNYVKIEVRELDTYIVPNYNADEYFEQYHDSDLTLNFTVYDENNCTVNCGSITIWMDGNPYTANVNSKGQASFNRTIKGNGIYGYNVKYDGGGNYQSSFNFFRINSKPVPTKIVFDKNITGILGESCDVTVTVIDTINNKPVTEGYITFVIPQKSQMSIYLTEGVAIIHIDKLDVITCSLIAISYIDIDGPYLYSSADILLNVTAPIKVD